MAVIHFFFEETQFTGFTKGELFGFTEFLCKYTRLINKYNKHIIYSIILLKIDRIDIILYYISIY